MRNETAPARRFEWKYRVPSEVSRRVLARLEPHLSPDPFCEGSPRGSYLVRSLYYDTPDLRFYHETKDGLKIRKKLRVRSYDAASANASSFLEIKRKQNQTVLKERLWMPIAMLPAALDGADPATLLAGRPECDRRTLERFRSHLHTLGLASTAVVSYERQAFFGRVDPRVRVTVDTDLRGAVRPTLAALVEAPDLHPFETECVLELKFDERPPRWLMQVVSELRLRRQPYSKYCRAIDHVAGAPEALSAGTRSLGGRF